MNAYGIKNPENGQIVLASRKDNSRAAMEHSLAEMNKARKLQGRSPVAYVIVPVRFTEHGVEEVQS